MRPFLISFGSVSALNQKHSICSLNKLETDSKIILVE
jgi:hypothetical protein